MSIYIYLTCAISLEEIDFSLLWISDFYVHLKHSESAKRFLLLDFQTDYSILVLSSPCYLIKSLSGLLLRMCLWYQTDLNSTLNSSI